MELKPSIAVSRRDRVLATQGVCESNWRIIHTINANCMLCTACVHHTHTHTYTHTHARTLADTHLDPLCGRIGTLLHRTLPIELSCRPSRVHRRTYSITFCYRQGAFHNAVASMYAYSLRRGSRVDVCVFTESGNILFGVSFILFRFHFTLLICFYFILLFMMYNCILFLEMLLRSILPISAHTLS